jgi:hypothetical protein
MALAKKMILLALAFPTFAICEGDGRSVYFPAETPYLSQISDLLSRENYRLFEDSLKSDLVGILTEKLQDDTLFVEVAAREHNRFNVEKIGSFSIQKAANLEAWPVLKRYLFWTVLANTSLLLLYFLR